MKSLAEETKILVKVLIIVKQNHHRQIDQTKHQ